MREIIVREEKLIAVEGKDEVNFIQAILDHWSIRNVQLINLEGKDNFGKIIPALKNIPGFDKVVKFGIVRDADNDSEAALKSVQGALGKAGLAQPRSTNEFAGKTPSVGVFIMPGNEEEGMLEDLCLKSIQDSSAVVCIDKFFECINKDTVKHLSKAKVQVYLSTKPEIVSSLGIGARKGYWDLDNGCFKEFNSFLNNFS